MKHQQTLIDKRVDVSPPARGRGLKLALKASSSAIYASPPARGRGLKRESRNTCAVAFRRPPRGGVD